MLQLNATSYLNATLSVPCCLILIYQDVPLHTVFYVGYKGGLTQVCLCSLASSSKMLLLSCCLQSKLPMVARQCFVTSQKLLCPTTTALHAAFQVPLTTRQQGTQYGTPHAADSRLPHCRGWADHAYLELAWKCSSTMHAALQCRLNPA
jgi:hypothetical protein